MGFYEIAFNSGYWVSHYVMGYIILISTDNSVNIPDGIHRSLCVGLMRLCHEPDAFISGLDFATRYCFAGISNYDKGMKV